MSLRGAGLALAALVVAAPFVETARAQSLGEAAARERQKREKAKKTREAKPQAPAYTNEDLEGESGKPGETAESESPAAAHEAWAEAERVSVAEGGSEGEGGEQQWRQRADDARRAVADAERVLAEAEARAAQLLQDRDPLSGLQDPNRLQTLEAERAQAAAEVEAARKSLAGARQALADLEEQARRQSVPPGWLRER